jgi:hypothetical protein
MMEYTRLVNALFDAGAAVQTTVKNRWPGASVSFFDVHALLTDIYEHPTMYLDAPYNSTGYWHQCPPGGSCTNLSKLGPLSGFMWYDELHPSEKTGTFSRPSHPPYFSLPAISLAFPSDSRPRSSTRSFLS